MSSRVIAGIAVLAFGLYCFVFIAPLLGGGANYVDVPKYEGVIELWHIETFEGGSGSRASWLSARAAKFEKKHKGLYVHVSDYTYEQALDKLQSGETFDMVSFSAGVGNALLRYLMPAETAASGSFLQGGEADGVQYALPYSAGVYAMFARQSDLDKLKVTDLGANAFNLQTTKKIGKNTVEIVSFECGFGRFNSPLTALAQTPSKGKLNPDYAQTQYQAYEKFVSGKKCTALLGTQRDMYRLSNRYKNGKIDALVCVPLQGYTDLVQYVAISADAGQKTQSAREFVQYLTSEEVQKTLTNISMFSPCGYSLYTDDWFASAEKSLENARTVNVFANAETLEQIRRDALVSLGG
ncbi:MAG: ABC transporter substrate-binding protein [Corallococcus sp.]|nr:ABC transporter substrate-binding protein [Corallococcus sp.]